MRLLKTWTGPLLEREVICFLTGYRNNSEPVLIPTPDNYTDGTVLAIDQGEELCYKELTLLPFSKNLAQLAIKTIVSRPEMPIGSIYPLQGTDLQTIEDLWGSSPIHLQRATNASSLILSADVPVKYYSVDPLTIPGPVRVNFTDQTHVSVIHMQGKHPNIQIFDLNNENVLARVVPTNYDRFDVYFTPALSGYLLY